MVYLHRGTVRGLVSFAASVELLVECLSNAPDISSSPFFALNVFQIWESFFTEVTTWQSSKVFAAFAEIKWFFFTSSFLCITIQLQIEPTNRTTVVGQHWQTFLESQSPKLGRAVYLQVALAEAALLFQGHQFHSMKEMDRGCKLLDVFAYMCWNNCTVPLWTSGPQIFILETSSAFLSVYERMDHDAGFGHDTILSRSPNSFICLLIANSHYFHKCIETVFFFVSLMTCSNDVDIIDYQGCQPANEKLSDQPNKIITFSPKLFSNLRNNHTTRKHSNWQDRKSISAYKTRKIHRSI